MVGVGGICARTMSQALRNASRSGSKLAVIARSIVTGQMDQPRGVSKLARKATPCAVTGTPCSASAAATASASPPSSSERSATALAGR